MKVLHIIKERTPAGFVDTIVKGQSDDSGNDVTVVNLYEDKDYAKVVDLIFSSDRVFTW
ncbi:MAG: hypothetical protein WC828_01910 [Thermoleophilia bacterium]|jgi:hypothetical protein